MRPYLTLVFQQPIDDQVKSIFESGGWSAASHSHVIADRIRMENEVERQAKLIDSLEDQVSDLITILVAATAIAPHGSAVKQLLDSNFSNDKGRKP